MFEGLSATAGYEFLPDDPPPNVGALRARYVRQCHGGSEDGSEHWYNWVVRRQRGDETVGYTQATVRAQVALIAYHIFPDSWREGIGSAAVREMLRVVFGLSDAEKAIAQVDTRNERSMALLCRLGFRRGRLIREADFFKRHQSDEWEYELHRRDWTETGP